MALDTLINSCVKNPLLPARGGRAYYGQQSMQLNGWRIKQEEELTDLCSTTYDNGLAPRRKHLLTL